MSAPVFITHSSLDYRKARAIVDALEKHGIKCWISERDIGAGDNFGDAIVDAIEHAVVMVLVFSGNANNSEEIKKEIALASQRKITVVPVRLEDTLPSKAFRYELVTRNWIDLFPHWGQGIQRLVDRITSITSAAVSAQASEILPSAPRRPAAPAAPIWIAAMLVGMAVAATPIYLVFGRSHSDVHVATGEDAKADPGGTASGAQSAEVLPADLSHSNSVPSAEFGESAKVATLKPVALRNAGKATAADPLPPPPLGASTKTSADPLPQGPIHDLQRTSAVDPLPPPPLAKAPTNRASSAPIKTAALVPIAPVAASDAGSQSAPKIGPPPSSDPNTRGGQIFKECEHCPEMVVVPRGSAVLGAPLGETGRQSFDEAPHEVTIAQPFAVGRFTVTFDEWNACVADGGCNQYSPDDTDFGGPRLPVVFVSWDDAQAYVAWLTKKTGQPYRLLSEAEWEYAARGCTSADCPNAPFWFGTIRPELANYDARFAYNGSPKAERQRKPMPVDSGKPNPFGLFNVLGNVQQWTEDCWNPSLSSIPTDAAPVLTGDCADRVVRGGSWADKPGALRAAARSWAPADYRESANIGIRVARTLSQ